jgi:16S rRNA processing protein RimM
MVLVGRVGRSHGIRGQVAVNTETDFAEDRFTPGAAFWTRGGQEQLTIGTVRFQNGKPIVGFEGVTTPDAAERLRGVELRVPEDTLRPLDDGVYYHHQLEGCVVETVAGERIGEVARVDGGVAGSLLVVNGPRGEVLIPLAVDICVAVDVAARRITVSPPDGLLDVNERRERPERPPRHGRPRRAKRARGAEQAAQQVDPNASGELDPVAPADPSGSSESNG